MHSRLLMTSIAVLLTIGACAESEEGGADLRNDSIDTTAPGDAVPGSPSGELPSPAIPPGADGAEREVDTTTAAADDALADGRWSHAVQYRETASNVTAQVNDIRIAEHEGYDRLVLAFSSDHIPAYNIRYIEEPPTECGSGRTVEIAGTDVLQIRLEPARGYTQEGSSTVSRRHGDVALPALREYVVSCDFEAVFTVFAGVRGGGAYRILELRDPARLAVDVRHSEP